MKKNTTIKKLACLAFSISLLCACTEPGETTYVGSATGGVLGAGLGAIIGNQTGNAGSGLAIGAVAGAGAGAAIGNALEAQQKSIRTQDEAIERQQKILAAQNAEIQELRGSPSDSIGSSARPRMGAADVRGSLSRDAALTEQLNGGSSIASDSAGMPANSGMAAYRDRSQTTSAANLNSANSLNSMDRSANLKETDLQAAPALQQQTDVTATKEANTAKMADTSNSDTAECQKAQTESQKAEAATEGADKLFYLRRAIRLCPSKAIYHKNLADQYLSLGRNEDAKAAYADAIRLDPTMTEAGEAMSAISSNNIY